MSGTVGGHGNASEEERSRLDETSCDITFVEYVELYVMRKELSRAVRPVTRRGYCSHISKIRGTEYALRWSDVDLEGRSIRISRSLSHSAGRYVLSSPKAESSLRNVPFRGLLLVLTELMGAGREPGVLRLLHRDVAHLPRGG